MMNLIACLVLSVLWPIGVVADDILATGSLDSIINIVVIEDNQLKQSVQDLRLQSTPSNGSRIARIYCDNNNLHGFSLTFESDKGGKLVFYEPNNHPIIPKEGEFIPYVVDVQPGEMGYLGTELPPESERLGLNLAQPAMILFDDNVFEATHQAELFLAIHTNKKASLFNGVYHDTITITIQDV